LCTLLLALFCFVLCCSILPSNGFPTHAVVSIYFKTQLSEYERRDVGRSLPAARITEVGDAVVVVGSTAPTEDIQTQRTPFVCGHSDCALSVAIRVCSADHSFLPDFVRVGSTCSSSRIVAVYEYHEYVLI
jgi:hypothetical protein